MKVLSAVQNDDDIVPKKYVDDLNSAMYGRISDAEAKAARMIIAKAQISYVQPDGQSANDVWLEII